ncbi:DUF4097 family beta strand repeat protein [Hymenobacter sp. BT507]|uniref:DUF4097 family beta strand repeat protein n=1 Tax=Hymenobacter citatus TaxID=2763506 RepID=A0ABR7MHB4_9BACT|nr:DUF4097 family beta strand repeat-containing protein [Hymenobacter citatus]MBC6610479.1 DUF4097 family beta strand repeat protein [Hymenobacter citatus]
MSSIVQNRCRVGVLVLLWLLSSLGAYAQQKVQVVTRTLEQRWVCKPNTSVRIRAEKATLRVQGWDKPIVQVVLRLSARHPDRAIAERDLAAAQYRLQQNVSAINLVNFFSLPTGAPTVQSDLRAEYTVMMPAGNHLVVANTYGHTSLVDLYGWQQLEQDFGRITLQNLQGSVAVTARYADVTATDVEANFTCEANKSAIRLLRIGGTATIHNQYGSVHAQPIAYLHKLVIEADRTEVTISASQPEQFAYQLSVQQGRLLLPNSYQMAKHIAKDRATLATKNASTQPIVRVSTSYAPLTLQTQELVFQP